MGTTEDKHRKSQCGLSSDVTQMWIVLGPIWDETVSEWIQMVQIPASTSSRTSSQTSFQGLQLLSFSQATEQGIGLEQHFALTAQTSPNSPTSGPKNANIFNIPIIEYTNSIIVYTNNILAIYSELQ